MIIKGLAIAGLITALGGASLTLHKFLGATEKASKQYELAMEECRLIPRGGHPSNLIDPTDRVEEMQCYKAAEAAYAREIEKAMPEKAIDALQAASQQLRAILDSLGVDNLNLE